MATYLFKLQETGTVNTKYQNNPVIIYPLFPSPTPFFSLTTEKIILSPKTIAGQPSTEYRNMYNNDDLNLWLEGLIETLKY